MAAGPTPKPNEEEVSRFVEHFASALADAGIARMPSRVFAALLATESGRLTAAELADRLQASPAAISGAVGYLTRIDLVRREREPGSRRDQFVVGDDVWYEAAVRKDRILSGWERSLREGIDVLGSESTAGRRLAETLAFSEFVEQEMAGMLDKWRARKAELRGRGEEPR